MKTLTVTNIFRNYRNKLGFLCTAEIDANTILKSKESFIQKLPKGYPKDIAWCAQTHEDTLYTANKNTLFDEEADAIITQEKNTPLLIRTADCLAVFIYDPKTETIANIHAGWKSQALEIVGKTIYTMKEEFGSNPKNLLVYSSPSLGVCCGEFSNPYEELPSWMHPFIKKNNHVDLKEALEWELKDNGILRKNILINKTCTCCSSDWPSHRQNKTPKRITNLFWLK